MLKNKKHIKKTKITYKSLKKLGSPLIQVPRTVHYVAESSGRRGVSCVAVDVTKREELLKIFRENGRRIGDLGFLLVFLLGDLFFFWGVGRVFLFV